MRYAIYYAPEVSSPLWRLGCKWLGRDAAAQSEIEQDRFAAIDPGRIAELTRIARHYGLHATLKPPFRLAGWCGVDELKAALSNFVSKTCGVKISGLVLREIDDFFCLSVQESTAALDSFAAVCVEEFEPFRAVPDKAELERRSVSLVRQSQRDNLVRWGYPFVMEDFRFHITLSDRITNRGEKEIMRLLLNDLFAPVLGRPLVIDAICLFVEPDDGGPFYLSHRFPLEHIPHIF